MQTITINGLTFSVRVEQEDYSDAPWDCEDGHGLIHQAYKAEKKAGWRKMAPTGTRDVWYFYDVQETMKIAKAEGWDAEPYGGTPGERAARAVAEDFERMRGWCEGDWHYCGVIVTLLDADGEPTDESEALWGIGSDCYDYLREVAQELAQGIAGHIVGETSEVAYWASRDVVTVARAGV